MPLLNWSPGALAALNDKGQREDMTRLFDAYFRVAGEKSSDSPTGKILHLDLPNERKTLPTAVYAKFTKATGWVVQAALKPEHRVVSKAADTIA